MLSQRIDKCLCAGIHSSLRNRQTIVLFSYYYFANRLLRSEYTTQTSPEIKNEDPLPFQYEKHTIVRKEKKKVSVVKYPTSRESKVKTKTPSTRSLIGIFGEPHDSSLDYAYLAQGTVDYISLLSLSLSLSLFSSFLSL